jgi:asparagine synthase (glutamine-hydrolysing)
MPEGMMGRNYLRHFAYEGPRRYLNAVALFGPAEINSLLTPDVYPEAAQSDAIPEALNDLAGHDDWLSAVQHWDLQSYLPLDILPKVDRMTMAHSIEARPALLDHRLVEFAASVPPQLRLRGTTTKYLFKRAMRGILPDSVIDREKRGFAIPLAQWLQDDWSGVFRDLLLSTTCRQRGIFQPQYVERLLHLNDRGRDMSARLWALASFELWCRLFLDSGGRHRGRGTVERRPEAVAHSMRTVGRPA